MSFFKHFFWATIIVVTILGSLVPLSRANDGMGSINWLIWNLPPEFIAEGPWANQGYADKFLAHFKSVLPEYRHETKRVNTVRWSREALKPGYCTAHVWGGFFPGKLYYSKAYTLTPPHVLIFHERDEARLGRQGTALSLKHILELSDLSLAVLPLDINGGAGESRYPILYDLLLPYRGKKNLVELKSHTNSVNLKLIERGKFDYTIGYPSTVFTQERVYGVEDNFNYYPIKEHDFYKKVHAACSNDAMGRKIIDRIDASLTKEVLGEFIEYHDEWNEKDPLYRQSSEDHFINAVKRSNILD